MPEMPKPSQPLRPAERFPRPFLRGRRCRLLHFQPAAERLREAFLLPAAELRSAWLAARTSPAFGARPHGCPSYNPLCATVSLRVHTVNMESPSASYRSNPDMPKKNSRRCAQGIDIGVVSRPPWPLGRDVGAVRKEGYSVKARAVRGDSKKSKGSRLDETLSEKRVVLLNV